MKRNWDTIRRILIKAEALPTADSVLESDQVDFIDPQAAAYHMRLIIEAGLAAGHVRQASGPPSAHIECLTWEGHELLDSLRRETVWNRIKELAREKGMDLSLDAIRLLAKLVLEQVLR